MESCDVFTPAPVFLLGTIRLRMVQREPAAKITYGGKPRLIGLSYVLGHRHFARATIHSFECAIVTVGDARPRFPVQFCLITMFFVVFDLEAVFIYAWAVAARESGCAWYVEVMVFTAILLAALVYLWCVGALDWPPPAESSARTP
jgi:NADH-quinone oxidoreductase subunit A